MKLGPARRSVSRSNTRRLVRKQQAKQAIEPVGDASSKVAAATPDDANGAPLTPKAIQTLSIPAPALALAPAVEGRTVGFTTATEAWTGEGAFASVAGPTTLPPGVTTAQFDEVNEIDLAADAEAKTAGHTAQPGHTAGVSLVAPANAATPSMPSSKPGATASEPEPSWLSRLYGKFFDAALTVVLTIRAWFV
ncbi:MAG: hypothetical protein GEU91_10920 [Rhizobiales bacterium]|nr:hypothetical protein [Hyphomicrobiales bacterium]